MNRIYIRFALVVFIAIEAFSSNYYISKLGSDQNNGLSPDSCWKTMAAISGINYNPGDTIYFKCGEVFEGSVTINFSGTLLKPIVITSYGSGQKPIITGAIGFSNWVKGDIPVIKVTSEQAITSLYAGNKKQILARYPNRDFLLMEGKLNNGTGFYDSKLAHSNGYWDGVTVRYRGNWQAGHAKVISFTNHEIIVSNGSLNEFNPDNGYYFDNKLEELDTCNEWYYSCSDKLLYYYPQTPTSLETVKAVVYNNGISISPNVSNIILKGLRIDKYDEYGIVLLGNNKNIHISNCTISNINGTGIHINEKAKECSITSCDINSICGRGIYALEPEKLFISENQIRKIGFHYGYGISGVHGMVGIALVNHETKKEKESPLTKNNYIGKNIIDSIGYVGIRCDGTNNVIEKNLVYNTMLSLNDGGAIYCWATGPNYTHHNIIRNNLVFNCVGNITGTQPGPDGNMARGIYLDNHVNNILVEGNTIVKVSHAGIYINDGSHDNLIKQNTIYNANTGICINVYTHSNTTTSQLIEQNIICGIKPGQRLINFIDWTKPNTDNLASLNNNIYINLNESFLFQDDYEIENKTIKVRQIYQFNQWQNHKQQDRASLVITRGIGSSFYTNATLFFNETNIDKEIDLTKHVYYNQNGDIVNNILTIKPFSSQILLRK